MADLPQDAFAGHAAIVGRTGAGKSYAARGIVERWLGEGRRVCVIDPTDVWWGLRADAAGTGPGFPVVVFGGEHADIAVGEGSGARVAEIVGTRNLPAVVATAEMTSGERHRFMADFLGALYRANRTPLHLVLDEADDLAPQNPLPENRRMLGDVDRIVRRGRVRGFRVLMLTQRPAVLHKNVLAQAGTLVALRLPAPQDRRAIEDWVRGQADLDRASEMLGELARLGRGEGWVWAPDRDVFARHRFPAIATFDSMRTPEDGHAAAAPGMLAAVDVAELRELLAATGGAAAVGSDAGDEELARLRHRNAELHRELEEARRLVGLWQAGVVDAIERLRAIGQAPAGLDAAVAAPKEASRQKIVENPPAPAENMAPRSNGTLPSSAAKMLAVLARGLRLSWPQTATLAGLKARGGSFNAGRKALRDAGYVADDGNAVRVTDAGLAAAGGARPPPATPEELVLWWRAALPQTSARVLDQLFRQGPKWIRRDRLAGYLGVAPRGGSWNTALSILRQNMLIEQKGDQIRAHAGLWSRP